MTAFTRASRASLRLAVIDLSTANRSGDRDKRKIRHNYPNVKNRKSKSVNYISSLSNLLHTQAGKQQLKAHILENQTNLCWNAALLIPSCMTIWQLTFISLSFLMYKMENYFIESEVLLIWIHHFILYTTEKEKL